MLGEDLRRIGARADALDKIFDTPFERFSRQRFGVDLVVLAQEDMKNGTKSVENMFSTSRSKLEDMIHRKLLPPSGAKALHPYLEAHLLVERVVKQQKHMVFWEMVRSLNAYTMGIRVREVGTRSAVREVVLDFVKTYRGFEIEGYPWTDLYDAHEQLQQQIVEFLREVLKGDKKVEDFEVLSARIGELAGVIRKLWVTLIQKEKGSPDVLFPSHITGFEKEQITVTIHTLFLIWLESLAYLKRDVLVEAMKLVKEREALKLKAEMLYQ